MAKKNTFKAIGIIRLKMLNRNFSFSNIISQQKFYFYRSRMTSEDALRLFCKEPLMKRNKFATSLKSTVSHTETANTPVLMITVTTIFLPEVIRAILAPEPETQPVTQLATLMTDVFSVSMKGYFSKKYKISLN